MNSQCCPGLDLLQGLVQGRTPPEETRCLENHLESCADCRKKLAQLKSQNTFMDSNSTGEYVPAKQAVEETVFLISSPDTAPQTETSDTPKLNSFNSQFVPKPSRSRDSTLKLNERSNGSLPSSRPVLQGVSVPGYDILEELGRGGMGVVYKARHRQLQRMVALKMILAGSHAGESSLARFAAEAEAVAQLQHPNIVQIYETGTHEGRPYFSLEFVDGGSLEARMKENPTSPKGAAELVEILARAMDFAHQRGMVHRDLKPANILLATAGNCSTLMVSREHISRTLPVGGEHWSRSSIPKIADFGLVKRLESDSSQTQSGTIVGTPSYMAPEQAAGKNNEVGPASDTYSLGAILYDLLVGRPPFRASNPIDTIRQVLEQEPVPPRQLEPRVPRDLETICLKCLEKDPGRRYASALALAEDLRCFLDDSPILARPIPAWERAWKWGKRRPTTVALMAVSLAAVVGMASFIVWHNVSLGRQLTEAREDERMARQREAKALEEQRLSRIQIDGQKLFDRARFAVAAKDWSNARLHLTNAVATIGEEERFAEMKASAQTLLEQVEQELRVATDRQASEVRFQEFAKLRDEAQFLGTLYNGMDMAANVKSTRAAVQRALAVYAVSTDRDPRPSEKASAPQFDAYLSASQQTDILADCYQLVLILAETHAQSASDLKSPDRERSLEEARRVLKQALRFGMPSKAYHLRYARYSNLLGDTANSIESDKAAKGAAVALVLDHFLVGDELYRCGKFEEASREFDIVLQLKPADFWAEYINALCLLRLHRAAEAKTQLSACLAQRADFVWLYLLRGFAYSELQAFEAAAADFAKALELPLDDSARYVLFVNRGGMRIRQGLLDDAVADLNAAIQLKPKEYQAYVNLANAYRGKNKLDLALEQLNRAIELDATLAHLYRLRARLLLERKEPALALADFNRAIERESADNPFYLDDLVERGRLLLREQKYADALASFDAALQVSQKHSIALRLKAEALMQLGRHSEAVDAYDRYLENGKPLESVYRGRGLALAELGKYPGAIESFTRALDLEPTSAVQTFRGWAHLVCEAPRLALRDFELAIALDPKNGDAYNGRGFVEAQLGKRAEAIRDAEEAVRLGPQTPRLLYNSARVLAQCAGEQLTRAVELIEKALNLLPAEERATFWMTNIKNDTALGIIRIHPKFQKLQAEILPKK